MRFGGRLGQFLKLGLQDFAGNEHGHLIRPTKPKKMRAEERHLPAGQLAGEQLGPLLDRLERESRMLRPRVRHIDQADRHKQRTFLAQQIMHGGVIQPLHIDVFENMIGQPFVLLPGERLQPVLASSDLIGFLCGLNYVVHRSPRLRERDAQLVIAGHRIALHEKI